MQTSTLFPTFHFALRPRGYLFLGGAESATQFADLFSPIDTRQRIYQRRDHVAPPVRVALPRSLLEARSVTQEVAGLGTRAGGGRSVRQAAEAAVLERFGPAHVVVNRQGDVVHYSARTGQYLEAAIGQPTRNLLALTRRGLRAEVQAALQEALQSRRIVTRTAPDPSSDNAQRNVTITVGPLPEAESDDPLFLVVFTEAAAASGAAPPLPATSTGDEPLALAERELRDMRERQQILIEEYEAAVAELQASNEEQVSVNEELQSANEELETAKEEQQSVNEELHTVNMELNTKIEQLDRANDDLRNLFEATGVATIILDEELAIRSFTPAVAGLFHLRPADCGRPLADIAGALDTGDVLRDAQRVLTDGATVERPVQRRDGSAEYLLRLVPYRAENGAVNGVLAAFVDITALAQAAKEREEQRLMVAELNHRVRNMLAVVGALTRQTLEADRPVAELADALVGRIGALAEAYQLIAREAWGDTPLAELVHRQLAPHLSHESRGTVEGPPVLLRASHALAVGLVLHELATNAVKYGALSGQHGHVAVTWETRRSATAASLVIRWQEQGGPPVSEPLREGFGSQLVHGQVELALNGTYEEHFAPEGFSATISIPMEPS